MEDFISEKLVVLLGFALPSFILLVAVYILSGKCSFVSFVAILTVLSTFAGLMVFFQVLEDRYNWGRIKRKFVLLYLYLPIVLIALTCVAGVVMGLLHKTKCGFFSGPFSK
ncbi:membrane protein [Candidatus Magnetobacterium bavaricum]|uniref:Membrane protein n=1 Tax=Candidatus Magnetobacterium bavaricum TaxID=29290 RepID=A0A0F3GW07_9BACT|nr:membrane protein [Candidatus Magnetobacterium bavaricum]